MDPRWLFLIVSTLGSAAVVLGVMHLSLAPWRKVRGEHWSVRAQVLHPARRAFSGAVLGCFGSALLAWIHFFPAENGWRWMSGTVVGLVLACYPAVREIEPRYTLRIWLTETFVHLSLRGGLLAIGLWLLTTMPVHLAAADWIRVGLGVAVVGVLVTGFWLPALNRLWTKKHPDLPRLVRVTEEAAAISGVQPRYLWLDVTPIANGFAIPSLHAVIITSRLMEILDDDELRAVILHEMAHLKERRVVKLMRILAVMSWMSFIFARPIYHQLGFKGIALLVFAVYGLRRLAFKITQRMETTADSAAVTGSEDPAKYGRALEKIYEVNQIPIFTGGDNTHPDLLQRMERAGAAPTYPIPEPPGPMAWPGRVILAVPISVGFWMGIQLLLKTMGTK